MSSTQEMTLSELIGIINSLGADRNNSNPCDEVYPNIWIGDQSAATNVELLARLGITHVVNAAEGKSPGAMVNTGPEFYRDANIKYLGVSILDLPDVNASVHFQKVTDFIDQAVRGGGKVLVHCVYGVSRSTTFVLAYLVTKKNMGLAEALKRVLRKRPCVKPNDGFLQQLVNLQQGGNSGKGNGALKDKQFDCVCFYVESPGRTSFLTDECSDCKINQKYPAIQGIQQNKTLESSTRAQQSGSRSMAVASGPFEQPYDCCDDPVIPYPKPPPSVELRSGVLISGCQCVKRDGLQHDCPRTGCQGRAPCMAFPAPICIPSGNAQFLPPEPQSGKQRYQDSQGYRSPGYEQHKGGSHAQLRNKHPTYDNPQNEKYVRLARRGYVENPPAKEKRVPCREHRKIRA